MAEEKPEEKKEKKEKGGRSGKIVRKPKKPVDNWKKYRVEGDALKRSNNSCPKCGPGMFLAAHKGRSVCGKCGYVEMASKQDSKDDKDKKKDAPKDGKPEPKKDSK